LMVRKLIRIKQSSVAVRFFILLSSFGLLESIGEFKESFGQNAKNQSIYLSGLNLILEIAAGFNRVC
jgi:hypothetical protein